MPFGDKVEAVKKEIDEKIGAVKKEVRQAIAMEAKRAEEAGQPLLPEEVAKIADDKLDLVKIGIGKDVDLAKMIVQKDVKGIL